MGVTDLFRRWRYNVPKTAAETEPLGYFLLTEFWRHALQLVDADVGQTQEVITLIASEGSMLRVAETIGQDFESISDGRLKSVFEGHLLPFFQVITNRNVTASAILHAKVMSIYNVIFSIGGVTAISLFAGTVRHLSSISPQSVNNNAVDTEFRVGCFEATARMIDKVIEVNSTAKITQELVSAVEVSCDTILSFLSGFSPLMGDEVVGKRVERFV